MKKQELKKQLNLSSLREGILIDMLKGVSEKLTDTTEALRRRRVLYDRLASHSTIEKPKSMMEMAEALYIQCMARPDEILLAFQELPEAEQDLWMDRLLTILN